MAMHVKNECMSDEYILCYLASQEVLSEKYFDLKEMSTGTITRNLYSHGQK